jgi:hypothetical protein
MNLGKRLKVAPIILWVSSIACIFLALKTCGDPIPTAFQNTFLAHSLQRFPTGNALIFNLSVGFLVSVIFYLLVVWYPEKRTKNLIKRSLEERYRYFKEDTIAIFLSALGNSYRGDLPRSLSDQNSFKEYFKAQATDSQTRWDAVLNGLGENHLRDLVVELEILMNEVEFVLSNVTVDDGNAFLFFKRLCQAVYKFKNSTLGYDDLKQLSRFLWELFAGFSFIDGYRKSDIVKDMIKRI